MAQCAAAHVEWSLMHDRLPASPADEHERNGLVDENSVSSQSNPNGRRASAIAGRVDFDTPGFRYEKREHLAWITIDRPERGNSLLPSMHHTMRQIWKDVQLDPEIRVAIVTGAGTRHFCTGADVDAIAARGRVSQGRGPVENELFWSPRQSGVWKPVICAVNGTCAGAGLHFVADADIVFASPNARFLDAHVNIGMVGGVENAGLAYRLPLGSVLRMTLVGRDYEMPASRAYALGLVDELAEDGELLTLTEETARSIAANSPTAVTLSKQAIWRTREMGYRDAVEYAWSLVRMHWSHPDFAEGPRAFADSRTPEWVAPEIPGIEQSTLRAPMGTEDS